MVAVHSLPENRSIRDQVSQAEWEARVNLAAAYRLVHHYGWSDMTGTHLSLRVPDDGQGKEHFLINPRGHLFDQITASNLVKIDVDGNKVMEGGHEPVNKAGFVIHSAVHMANEEAACVMHSHAVSGMAVSMQKAGLRMLSQHAANFFGNLAYHDIDHMIEEEGGRAVLAADLGDKRAMIMRNHGLLTTGRTVAEAFLVLHTLMRACDAQIAAMSGGAELIEMKPETCEWFARFMRETSLSRAERAWPAHLRKADELDPSYRD